MSAERRFGEHEIAAIFKQAAEAQEVAQRQLSHSEGLTLAELQQIGKEAGITAEFIARAAAATARSEQTPPPTTHLGFPVSVARTIDLPGPLSDENWDRLVVDLRETFQASGEVRRDGSLRQWRNGNLHVLVEPTESGHRLRLRTLNTNLKNAVGVGLAFFVMGLLFMLILATTGDFGVDLAGTLFVSLFAAMGLGSIGVAAYRLRRWSEERARQMEVIAARTAERAGAQSATALRELDPLGRLERDMPAEPEDAVQARMQNRTRT